MNNSMLELFKLMGGMGNNPFSQMFGGNNYASNFQNPNFSQGNHINQNGFQNGYQNNFSNNQNFGQNNFQGFNQNKYQNFGQNMTNKMIHASIILLRHMRT